MARATWTGAVELTGFPVHVSLFNRIASKKRGDGFRAIAPTDKRPIRSVYLDSNGDEVARNETLKGVEVGKDEFVILDEAAQEAIGKAERSQVLEPKAFCPVESLDLDLATAHYEVLPDLKVAGAETSANQFRSLLKGSGLAYVSQLVARAGSKDAIVAFYAKGQKLLAAALPLEADLSDVPAYEWETDEQAEAKAGAFIEAAHGDLIGEYDRTKFESAVAKRREDAVAAVLAGKAPKATKAAPKPKKNDLMAALQEAVEGSDKPKPKAKAKSRRKVAA